jgi:hypothetical protein
MKVTSLFLSDVDEEEISFSIVNPPVPEIEINRDNFRPTHEGFSTIKPNATLSKQMMQNNPENEIKNQMMVYKQVLWFTYYFFSQIIIFPDFILGSLLFHSTSKACRQHS